MPAAQPWQEPAVASVLLAADAPSPQSVRELLTSVFPEDGMVASGDGVVDDGVVAEVTIDRTTVAVRIADEPAPGDAAQTGTRDVAMWNGGESVVDTHRSQVFASAEPGRVSGGSVAGGVADAAGQADSATSVELDDARSASLAAELAVASVAAALTALPDAVAVFVPEAQVTLPAEAYRSLVAGHPLPVPALVGVRAGWQSAPTGPGGAGGTACAFTSGLNRFGFLDLERQGVPGHPGEAFGSLCDLVAFQLGTGTPFADGQRIETGENAVTGEARPLTARLVESALTGRRVLDLS